MTIPQLFSVIAGALISIVSLIVFVGQRTRRFKALFWLAVGMALVTAAFRPDMIEKIGEDSAELRLRLVVAFLSFAVLTITLEAIRIGRMQERYAFLWLMTGLVMLIGALFEDIAMVVTRLTGMSYMATIMVVMFVFVMLMLFYLSVALSGLQVKLFQVARELALAEERLRRAEQALPPASGNHVGQCVDERSNREKDIR